MGEKPILFSAPMVRAILDGQKTQTRRVVKGTALEWLGPAMFAPEFVADPGNSLCPYGKAGDRLWVRETWGMNHYQFEHGPIPKARPADFNEPDGHYLVHRATEDDAEIVNELRWRPSIHMPRWASRITLEITGVRVERLHDISDADAEAEGCPPCPECRDVGWINSGPDGGWQCTAPGCGDAYRDQFKRLWSGINGSASWDANPWVWVIEFTPSPAVRSET